MNSVDIVLATYNRLPFLKKTLEYLWARTRTPYQLHIIDDGSNEGNTEYLYNLFCSGNLASLTLRKVSWGIPANLISIISLTKSPIIVFMDDDNLCPDVEPSWLARGLTSLEKHQDVGILALNNPSCNIRKSRHIKKVRDEITLCDFVGGQFVFIRREILEHLPEKAVFGTQSPVKSLCRYVRDQTDFKVAYLTETYCQHIGVESVRGIMGDISEFLLEPINDRTLEPPREYAY